MEQICELIAEGNTVPAAAAKLNIPPAAVYRHAYANPGFRTLYQAAMETRRAHRREEVADEAHRRVLEGTIEEIYEPGQDGAMTLVRQIVRRSPADLANAARIYGLEQTGGDTDDSRASQIAEALERFAGAVLSLADRGRAELAPGEPD
jgi:hypothetical protein